MRPRDSVEIGRTKGRDAKDIIATPLMLEIPDLKAHAGATAFAWGFGAQHATAFRADAPQEGQSC